MRTTRAERNAERNAIVTGVQVLLLVLLALPVRAEVVLVVASGNPISTLPRAQVVNIFLGRIPYLNQQRVMAVDQDEGSSVRDQFYRDLLGWSPAQVKAYWSKMIFTGRGQPPPTHGGDADIQQFVANNPGAIGYMERSQVTAGVQVVRVLP